MPGQYRGGSLKLLTGHLPSGREPVRGLGSNRSNCSSRSKRLEPLELLERMERSPSVLTAWKDVAL